MVATNSMFLRIVNGNVANPPPLSDPRKISAHTIIAALQMWANGEITKADIVIAYDLTHVDDSGDLDNLKAWFATAKTSGLEEKFSNVLEWRLILARDKRTAAGGIDLDGKFGFAVKNTFINGADGIHSLKDTGIMSEQFTTWAS